ncbi:MAG: DNA translocase FtsK 4TM domain-containing protein [Myxococcota bacterium]
MSDKKRSREKSVLSKQEIAVRRKALSKKMNQTSGAARRAIGGVVVLALSVLAFLAVATFDAHDRLGPGFHNAIGPVGHALAEALRGLFGVTALVLPLVGIYAAGLMFVGDAERRRWSQGVSLALLLVCAAVLAQLFITDDGSWSHPPGGLLGRELGGVMTALFSTVGTVVLVSALAAVAFIVGTQYAFLRFCAWAWDVTLKLGQHLKTWAIAFLAAQRERAAQRRLEAEKAAAEEAAFLAELEAQEAELSELEAAAAEAEAVAEESERAQREKEQARLADLAEKERLKAEREKAMVEREAARLAREALKTARSNQKEERKNAAAVLAPTLINEAKAQVQIDAPLEGDPAWATGFSFGPKEPQVSAPPLPSEYLQSVPPARRVPTIVEPPGTALAPPPPPPEALVMETQAAAATVGALPGPGLLESASGAAVSAPPPPVAAAAAALAPQGPAAAAALAPAGATALARTPLIIEPKAPPRPTAKKKEPEFEFHDGRTSFAVPPIDVLEVQHRERTALDKDAFLATAEKLSSKLKDFGIEGEVVEIRPGPVVTMYEFKPAPGVKISRIASLSDDLAMAMEAMRVRIVAPIPGKGVVGIEVPNKSREIVFLKEIAEQDAFQKSQSKLTMCLGKDIEGMPYILDLAKAPHLLMAGTTGSGKSVSVNAMIMSMLLKSTPEEVRFIMVDPKMLELSVYEGIPHLLLPVVTDPRKAAIALQWAVEEMTRRYKLLAEAGVRNISGYNTFVEGELAKKRGAKKAAEKTVDAKPIVLKPQVSEKKVTLEPPPAEAKPVEPTPAVEAAPPEKPKKKRRLLIVDVADENAPPPTPPEGTPAVEAKPAEPPPELNVGVAAPVEALEDPREGITPEVQAEVKAVASEAEIRVDESHVVDAESEQEAAALAEAAASSEPSGEGEQAEELKKLPYIVVIIDELADLMMVASKEVETSIARLAQMARAAGIHLMVATQRPSTDVVTGVIKANFPTRISFMLRSKPDSMTILGTIGAEALLGMGDMLIMPPTSAHLQRVHGCFVSESEIKRVVDHLKAQGKPNYDESILKPRDEDGAGEGVEEDDLSDELYDQAVAVVSEMRHVSISMLQRKMRIGYNRSARMIERMEREGLVGPADGAKPREVLIRPVGEMPGAGAL